MGSAGFAAVVPFRWPLTVVAALAVAAGWFFVYRRRGAFAVDPTCSSSPSTRTTFVSLSVASALVILSTFWGYIEAPLLPLLGDA